MSDRRISRRISGHSLRRGGTLALVLCLYLALGSILLGAVTVAVAAQGAAEREYRRSQALALAEAGIAEARSGRLGHGWKALGSGRYTWSRNGAIVTARGEVIGAAGPITRTVRVKLGPGGSVSAWEEGP